MTKKQSPGWRILIPLLFFGAIGWMIWSGGITLQQGTIDTLQKQLSDSVSTVTGHIYISPYTSHEPVLEAIKSAKYSIGVRGYQITDKAFINILKQKAYQGVDVRVILENNTYGDEDTDYLKFFEEIKKSPIKLKNDEHLGSNFQHAKTIIVDGERFVVGTANFTYGGFFANREHWFISEDNAHATLLQQQFENDWTEKKDPPINLPSSLRVCPHNCRDQLTNLIHSAHQSISIQAQYLADNKLIQDLMLKKGSGVTIKIIVGKFQDDPIPEVLQDNIKQMSDPNVHSKTILIDGKQLFIGSMNLSTNAIENNSEIGIVTADPKVIQKRNNQFNKDRQSSPLLHHATKNSQSIGKQ